MIICAAIKISEFYPDNPTKDLIICGHRHGNCFEVINELKIKVGFSHQVQGFIDHNGNFLNREEAFIHARQCGQISPTTVDYKKENGELELYSEDLY